MLKINKNNFAFEFLLIAPLFCCSVLIAQDSQPEPLQFKNTANAKTSSIEKTKAKENSEILPEVFNDEERLTGFKAHQKEAADFERERLKGIEQLKKNRLIWQKELDKTLPEYKREKSLMAAPLDENSKEYKLDIKNKEKFDLELELYRKNYVKWRDLAKSKKKSRIKLTEEEEYFLNLETVRADINKRALYNGKNKYAKSSGSSGPVATPPTFNNDFSPPPPPPPDYSPPPEMYEPDIPPPPPPGFDDIPPPIFDEPEF